MSESLVAPYNLDHLVALIEENTLNLIQQSKLNILEEGKYPFVTNNGKWTFKDTWSNGFFIGLLIHLQKITSNKKLLEDIDLLIKPLEKYKEQGDFQDIGYILYYSFALAYNYTAIKKYKDIVLEGADSLFSSLMPGGYLKCNWLDNGEQYSGVDSFMNINLWAWAYNQTKENKYLTALKEVVNHGINNLILEDGRTVEYVRVNYSTGEKIDNYNKNAFSENSVWARGHAWVINGLVAAFNVTLDHSYLRTLDLVLNFYITNSNNYLSFWDLKEQGDLEILDTSASTAIASSLLKLDKGEVGSYYEGISKKIFEQLVKNEYIVKASNSNNGLLIHASTPLKVVSTPGESQIWGDFFFMDLLTNLALEV